MSWALTKAWVAHQHKSKLSSSLQALARPLSTSVTQLGYSVDMADYESSSGIDTEIIRLNVQHLYGVLSELQALIGSPISVEEVIAIKGRLDMLGKRLAAQSEDGGGTTPDKARVILRDAANELDSLKHQLQTVIPGPQRSLGPVAVECPTCHASVHTVLGSLPGDSGMASCKDCGTRFHANRIGNGTVITRAYGATKKRHQVTVTCPSCQADAPFTVAEGSTTLAQRFCLKCYAKLSLDPSSSLVTVLRTAQPPTAGRLSTDGSEITCSLCEQRRRVIYTTEGKSFGVCQYDDVLLCVNRQTGPGPNVSIAEPTSPA
jgi:hypothetical protein